MPERMAGLRLLVVEDEALVAMLIEDILLDLDCVVIGPVGTVAQALALLHHEEIDGALLDVNLGGGERSYPVADALAARNVPFVFVTGYGEAGVEGRYAPVTVLQKPFDPRGSHGWWRTTSQGRLQDQQGELVADPRQPNHGRRRDAALGRPARSGRAPSPAYDAPGHQREEAGP